MKNRNFAGLPINAFNASPTRSMLSALRSEFDARIARAAEWQQGVTEVSIALRIVLQLEGAQMSASVSRVSTSGMVGGRGSGRD